MLNPLTFVSPGKANHDFITSKIVSGVPLIHGNKLILSQASCELWINSLVGEGQKPVSKIESLRLLFYEDRCKAKHLIDILQEQKINSKGHTKRKLIKVKGHT